VQLQSVATRLIEMGIITPEQGMIALKQGVYPDPHQLPAAQEKFVKEREKGYYTPLSVAQPIMDEEAPAAPLPKRTPGNSNGRPAGSNTETDKLIAAEEPHSRKGIQGVVYKVESLMAYAETALKKQYKRKRLSKEHKQMLESLSESVVMSREIDEWEATTEACIKDFNNIESLEVMPEVLEISEKHEVVAYPAAILYHSKKIKL
jgi:hypothetical protein